jgi:hypothetical protein
LLSTTIYQEDYVTTNNPVDVNADETANEPDNTETAAPTTPPPLPDEYTDAERSSMSENPAVAGHLETHWGF